MQTGVMTAYAHRHDRVIEDIPTRPVQLGRETKKSKAAVESESYAVRSLSFLYAFPLSVPSVS